MSLLLIKIAVTVTIVLALSIVAERVSPRWAGMLGGYPLGTAIVLIFIAYQEGAPFAAQSVIHTLAGLAANLSVFAVYGIILSLRPKTGFLPATLCALIAFFTIAIGLSHIEFNLTSAFIFIAAIILICLFSFRRFEETRITTAVRLSFRVTLVRAASACFVVLSITGLADLLGPEMAGVLASFPSTVLPMMVIVHITYGPKPVLTIIKHFPSGLGAMITFGVFYALYLEQLGLVWGTLASFAAATVYLLGFSTIQQKMRRKSSDASRSKI